MEEIKIKKKKEIKRERRLEGFIKEAFIESSRESGSKSSAARFTASAGSLVRGNEKKNRRQGKHISLSPKRSNQKNFWKKKKQIKVTTAAAHSKKSGLIDLRT